MQKSPGETAVITTRRPGDGNGLPEPREELFQLLGEELLNKPGNSKSERDGTCDPADDSADFRR